jgi:hypothetical protein
MVSGVVRLHARDRLALDHAVADRLRSGFDVQVLAGVGLTRALVVDDQLAWTLVDDGAGVDGEHA